LETEVPSFAALHDTGINARAIVTDTEAEVLRIEFNRDFGPTNFEFKWRRNGLRTLRTNPL
jgi:hypothetical protein